MSDEVRRSGRANKGHHTKNADALDEPIPKVKPKGKPEMKKGQEKSQERGQEKAQSVRAQSTASADQQNDTNEDDAIIRCVCGDQRDIRGRQMICCDRCEAWQHVKCLGLQEGDEWDEKTYFCEQCKPEDHVDLLAAMARGEKPWNRKKGSKATKAKQARQSDIKSEPKPEAVPEPQKVSTPASNTPQPTRAASKDLPKDVSNGHAEPKPAKKETPKRAVSPTGEKRRRETHAEKDDPSKRRKSSTQKEPQEQPQQASPTASDPNELPEKQRAMAKYLATNLSSMIKDASENRGYHIPENQTSVTIANRLAVHINYCVVTEFGEPSGNESPYVQQMRSLIFNVKKNAVLIDRLLSASLTPENLAKMSSEEMASEEKQREYAAIREANEKQMVLTEESQGPRIRKTHKGEEIIGGDDAPIEAEIQPTERRHRESIQEDHSGEAAAIPEPGSPMRVDSPEKTGRAVPLSVDTAPLPPVARQSFDINSIYQSVKSPSQEQQSFQRRQSSFTLQEKQPQGAVEDADVDRLLKDEDNDVVMSDLDSDPTICWRGSVLMQAAGPFDACARFVAGGDLGQLVPWKDLLKPSLPIQGRIDKAKGDDYIRSLSESEQYDVAVLALTPITPEGRDIMDTLFNYFHPRDRWGVVPMDPEHSEVVKDLYVIPIEAGGSNLPPFLEMLEHCTIETPRPHHLVLLALVAKIPETTKPQYEQTPSFERYPVAQAADGQVIARPLHVNGPPGPQPQFSPVTAMTPQGPGYGSPYPPTPIVSGNNMQPQPPQGINLPPHHRNVKAVEILGPQIDSPIAIQLLESVSHITEEQLRNLRHILDEVPEARTNMAVLTEHLFKDKVPAAHTTQASAPGPASAPAVPQVPTAIPAAAPTQTHG